MDWLNKLTVGFVVKAPWIIIIVVVNIILFKIYDKEISNE